MKMKYFMLASILFVAFIAATNAERINFRYAHAQREYKVPGQPEFHSKRDEIKWKLNYAKKTLAKAREIEQMAKKAAVHFGYYDGNKQGHNTVKNIIGQAHEVLMDASNKMGYSYEKY